MTQAASDFLQQLVKSKFLHSINIVFVGQRAERWNLLQSLERLGNFIADYATIGHPALMQRAEEERIDVVLLSPDIAETYDEPNHAKWLAEFHAKYPEALILTLHHQKSFAQKFAQKGVTSIDDSHDMATTCAEIIELIASSGKLLADDKQAAGAYLEQISRERL